MFIYTSPKKMKTIGGDILVVLFYNIVVISDFDVYRITRVFRYMVTL